MYLQKVHIETGRKGKDMKGLTPNPHTEIKLRIRRDISGSKVPHTPRVRSLNPMLAAQRSSGAWKRCLHYT